MPAASARARILVPGNTVPADQVEADLDIDIGTELVKRNRGRKRRLAGRQLDRRQLVFGKAPVRPPGRSADRLRPAGNTAVGQQQADAESAVFGIVGRLKLLPLADAFVEAGPGHRLRNARQQFALGTLRSCAPRAATSVPGVPRSRSLPTRGWPARPPRR